MREVLNSVSDNLLYLNTVSLNCLAFAKVFNNINPACTDSVSQLHIHTIHSSIHLYGMQYIERMLLVDIYILKEVLFPPPGKTVLYSICDLSPGVEANLDNLISMLEVIGCYEGAEICREQGMYMHMCV